MGMESFVAVSDYHGDRRDTTAAKLFDVFVADTRPKHRLFLGDLWDFRAIRIGASKEEKMHSLRLDFDAGMNFLKGYKPSVITLGNHDQRLFDLVEKDGLKKTGPLVDLAKIFISEFEKLTKKLGTVVLPYDKRKGVWKQGGLKFVHGFDGLDASNMAAIYGNVLYGHGHAIESAPAPDDEAARVARMIGCVCRLDMDFARAQTRTLRQQHGWAYGAFLGPTKHEVMQARVQHQQVVYADSLKIISA